MKRLKSNRILILMILMTLMVAVIAARNGGECGETCSGVCPIDAPDTGFAGGEVPNIMGGTNNWQTGTTGSAR